MLFAGAGATCISIWPRITYRTEQEHQCAAEREQRMTRIATEKVGLRAAKTLRINSRTGRGVQFYAVERSLCVLIEAESEDDAHYLCRDARLEFIGLCEK